MSLNIYFKSEIIIFMGFNNAKVYEINVKNLK